MRMGDAVVVTPEHVEITLSPAGLGSRFLAFIIDSSITILVPALLVRLLPPLVAPGAGFAIFMTAQLFLTIGYHVVMETLGGGRTIGKRALGLRVVDSRGLPITPAQSLVRNAARAVDSLPLLYAVGAGAVLADRYGRRLGDLAADTLVIEDDATAEVDVVKLSERRFNSLRTPRVLRQIRHRISLEERELLLEVCLRSEELEPASRYALMEHVGGYYRRELGVSDERLSGENLIRDLTSILFTGAGRRADIMQQQ